MTYNEETQQITAVIKNYFKGIFYGNTALLQSVFHPQAVLFGDVGDQPYFKTLPDYIHTVVNRKSPSQMGEDFRMQIFSIEIENGIAVARLRTPMYQFIYSDYLSLNKIEGKWWIVNKLFTALKDSNS
jgi:hypothetical protein